MVTEAVVDVVGVFKAMWEVCTTAGIWAGGSGGPGTVCPGSTGLRSWAQGNAAGSRWTTAVIGHDHQDEGFRQEKLWKRHICRKQAGAENAVPTQE